MNVPDGFRAIRAFQDRMRTEPGKERFSRPMPAPKKERSIRHDVITKRAGFRDQKERQILKGIAWKKQKGMCPYCTFRIPLSEATAEHRVPISRGSSPKPKLCSPSREAGAH